MKYVGIHTQQMRNNLKSTLLLIGFPLILAILVYGFIAIITYLGTAEPARYDWREVTGTFLSALPFVFGVVAIWFLIAYWGNTSMIRKATGARPL